MSGDLNLERRIGLYSDARSESEEVNGRISEDGELVEGRDAFGPGS